MQRASDPEACLSELVPLWLAPSADALHRVLVLHPHGRGSADAFEPMALLRKHHAAEPESSAATATLLLTDRRWRAGAGQLVRAIEASGVLSAEQLDGLALAFLTADRCLHWPVPDAWFTAESVTVVVSDDVDEVGGSAGSRGPAVAARDVTPPLRRWAAARLVAEEPAAWTRVLERARQLDARHAAAVVAGVFDSFERLPTAAQARLVTTGTTWPHHSVRRAALEVVAVRDGVHVASSIARADPNAKIRDWAAALGRPRPGAPRPDVPDPHRDHDRSQDDGDQATLF